MKTKLPLLFIPLLVAALATSLQVTAQKPKYSKPYNSAAQQVSNPFASNYSFRLYSAPNNAFGYDVFKDGKPVFHQFVLSFINNDGKRSFATKEQTEKAATLVLEKIKNGIAPLLTEVEIKKIVAYQN